MFKHYKPSEEEIAAVEHQVFLTADQNNISSQEELIGVLVKKILTFDYYYHYSDDHSVWTGGREKEEWIRSHIDEVEDTELRHHLSRCFNSGKSKEVIKPFSWGEYIYNTTKYQQFRFEGMSHERACYGVGLINWLNEISYSINRSGVAYRAVYSNNLPLASTILRNGYRWFDDELIRPASVPPHLWNELALFSRCYKQQIIKYLDLKEFLGSKVNLMFGEQVEVLLVNNFYMIFAY